MKRKFILRLETDSRRQIILLQEEYFFYSENVLIFSIISFFMEKETGATRNL